MKPAILLCVAGFAWGLWGSNASARLDISYLEKFEMTGEKVDCIRFDRIHETFVLDNSTIVFRMLGNDYYVNRMPGRCVGLWQQGTFAYDAIGGINLCDSDAIRADFVGSGGRRCLLGEFERLTKKPETGTDTNAN